MPTNEEGEFELVLGNRQLLSVFFIVVVLLGVFFTMGYILGRNTGPKTEMASTRPARPIEVPTTPPVTNAQPVDPSKPSPSTEPVKTEAVKPEPKKSEPEPKKPEPVVKAEPKPEPTPKPEPVKVKPEPEPKKAEPSKGGKGTYLQVSATTKKDGDALVAKLAARGFSAMTTPVPNSDLVRVLVGPIDDMAGTRAKLKAAGFADPIPRKL